MEEIITILNQLSLMEWILGSLLLFFFLVQLFFYLFFYKRPYSYQKKRNNTSTVADEILPPISVIITSKDNAVSLEKNLPAIMEQDYPNFEVIVVNCGSTDDTDIVLKAAEQKYSRLYHTYIPTGFNSVSEKKLALSLGIKAAKNDCLLFTEAYCKPCSKEWIKEYGKVFSQGKEVILGFCQLDIPQKTGLRSFFLYDNLIHHLEFLSMAILRKPFMGIYRNLAYKKELFFKNKGYASLVDIESREDCVYINGIAPKQKTGILISKESLTVTSNVNDFNSIHATNSSKQSYRGFHFRVFGMETMSKYLFYLSLICAIVLSFMVGSPYLAEFALVLFLLRFAVQCRVINLNSRLFNAGKFHVDLLMYDIFQPLYNFRFRKYATGKYKGKEYDLDLNNRVTNREENHT